MSAAKNKAAFLSYASQDAEAVLRIAEALRASGVEVWFDKNELVGGDAWDAKIRGQIGSCTLFVPIIATSTHAPRVQRDASEDLRFAFRPELRSAVTVRDRQNPNGFVPQGIGDVVAENFQIHPSISCRSDTRQRRMRFDPLDGRACFVLQSQPETGLDFFVTDDRLGQLGLRFRYDPCLHQENRRSRSANTSVAARDFAVPASTARRRRAISSSQAASTSGEKSRSSSVTSRRMRASFRRSAAGRSSASRVTSDSTFVMGRRLVARHFRSTGNPEVA